MSWIGIALVLLGTAPMAIATPGTTACHGSTGPAADGPMSVQHLAERGGLIYLFNRRKLIRKPYECSSYYLAHGLNIDARDPRPGHAPLTALTYAIKQNDLRLAQYLLDHGASLTKPAGHKHLKPLPFAYNLAFSYPSVNRNAMIGLLSEALATRSDVARAR